MPGEYFVGLISGTSMDAIDAALVEVGNDALRLVATHSRPWPTELVERMHRVAQSDRVALDELGQLDALAGEHFAAAAKTLIQSSGCATDRVRAIGSHGQTLRHRPDISPTYTLQIGDPNRIAQYTGITTIADFRRRDMAAGGQGAPLVPAFHAARLADRDEHRVVLNIGGIANITVIPATGNSTQTPTVTGFDTGPGNCLMDIWIGRHRQQSYDRFGEWSAQGKADSRLLQELQSDPYFGLTPPKSTGTEYFSQNWLLEQLRAHSSLAPEDVQATLLRLTTESVTQAIRSSAPDTQRVLVCGGGVHNRELMRHLADALAPIAVVSTAEFGLDPDWVEAIAFAWLAQRTLNKQPGNLPGVTGAEQLVVLGAIYLA